MLYLLDETTNGGNGGVSMIPEGALETFSSPLTQVVNLALRLLFAVLVGITGIKLVLASIAMATAVGEEKMQKKDDLTKGVKAFFITIAVTAAILVGGPLLVNWVKGMIK